MPQQRHDGPPGQHEGTRAGGGLSRKRDARRAAWSDLKNCRSPAPGGSGMAPQDAISLQLEERTRQLVIDVQRDATDATHGKQTSFAPIISRAMRRASWSESAALITWVAIGMSVVGSWVGARRATYVVDYRVRPYFARGASQHRHLYVSGQATNQMELGVGQSLRQLQSAKNQRRSPSAAAGSSGLRPRPVVSRSSCVEQCPFDVRSRHLLTGRSSGPRWLTTTGRWPLAVVGRRRCDGGVG